MTHVMAFLHDILQLTLDWLEHLILRSSGFHRVGLVKVDEEYFADFISKPADVGIEHFRLFLVPFRRVPPRSAVNKRTELRREI